MLSHVPWKLGALIMASGAREANNHRYLLRKYCDQADESASVPNLSIAVITSPEDRPQYLYMKDSISDSIPGLPFVGVSQDRRRRIQRLELCECFGIITLAAL